MINYAQFKEFEAECQVAIVQHLVCEGQLYFDQEGWQESFDDCAEGLVQYCKQNDLKPVVTIYNPFRCGVRQVVEIVKQLHSDKWGYKVYDPKGDA